VIKGTPRSATASANGRCCRDAQSRRPRRLGRLPQGGGRAPPPGGPSRPSPAERRSGAKRLLDEKAISQQDLRRAEADRWARTKQLDMAKTEVRRAEEAPRAYGVTNAEDPTGESGEYIPVRSPLHGVVLEKSITQGTAVTVGTPLYVVADPHRAMGGGRDRRDADSAREGGPPDRARRLRIPRETFRPGITSVAEHGQPEDRRVTVRCQVPNPGQRLKPEMYAQVTLAAGEPHRVLAVPSGAIQEIEGNPSCS